MTTHGRELHEHPAYAFEKDSKISPILFYTSITVSFLAKKCISVL